MTDKQNRKFLILSLSPLRNSLQEVKRANRYDQNSVFSDELEDIQTNIEKLTEKYSDKIAELKQKER